MKPEKAAQNKGNIFVLDYSHSHTSKEKVLKNCTTEPDQNHHPIDPDFKMEPFPPFRSNSSSIEGHFRALLNSQLRQAVLGR